MTISTALIVCMIVGISDGDTVTAHCRDKQIKIRLAEIDAPEKKQPWGSAAKNALSDICFNTTAQIRPITQDRYGRLVAHIECQGKDASESQLILGMAWVYPKYVTNKNLYTIEAHARMSRIGLWSDPDPQEPWTWRKQKRNKSQ